MKDLEYQWEGKSLALMAGDFEVYCFQLNEANWDGDLASKVIHSNVLQSNMITTIIVSVPSPGSTRAGRGEFGTQVQ